MHGQFQTFIYLHGRDADRVYDGDKEIFTSTARRHIQNLQNLFRSDEGQDRDGAGGGAPRAEADHGSIDQAGTLPETGVESED